MVFTQLLFTNSRAFPTHTLHNNPGKREGRTSRGFIKATSNPGMQLADPCLLHPQPQMEKERLSLKTQPNPWG